MSDPHSVSIRDAYYVEQMQQVIRIAHLVYPQHSLDVRFLTGDDPVRAQVEYEAGRRELALEEAAELLGRELIPGADGAPVATITATIPRLPTPLEAEAAGGTWSRRAAMVRSLGANFPVAFETLKFFLERRREKKSRTINSWRKIGRPRHVNTTPLTSGPDKRPAVIIALHWLEHGGAEKFGLDCINIARAVGLKVFVVADVLALQRLQSRLPQDDEDVVFLRFDRYLPPGDWTIALEQLVSQENVKCIHIHHCGHAYRALAHLKMVHPQLVTLDTTHIVEFLDGGFPRISGIWSRYLDYQHVISRQLVDFFRNQFFCYDNVIMGRLLPSKLQTVPTFRFNGDEEETVITFIGRLNHQKRPLVLMAIIRELARDFERRGRKARFNVVGEGPYGPLCQKWARRHRLSGQIEFHPAGTDIPSLLDNSHLLLLPSSNEGLALVCYEAVAHGVIPISTAVGAQGELVPPQLAVNPSPYETVKQTVDVVRNLQTDPTYRQTAIKDLTERYESLSADPRGEDVIETVYRKVKKDADAE